MLEDLAHVPVFAGVAAIGFALIGPATPALKRFGVVVVGCAVLGLTIECLQLLTATGDFELRDLWYDAIGAALGLAIAVVGLRFLSRVMLTAVVLVGCVIGLLLVPPGDGAPQFEYESDAVEQRCTDGASPPPSEVPDRVTPLIRYVFDGDTDQPIADEIDGLELAVGNREAVSSLESGGLAFSGESPELSSIEPPRALTDAVARTNEVSVEIWFSPAQLPQTGPVRIVTISEGTDFGEANLHVGIEGRAISFRVNTDCSFFNSTLTDDVLEVSTLTHVVATYRPGLAEIFIDGSPVVSIPTQLGYLDSWNPDMRIHVADEATADRPFAGVIGSIAFYDRTLPPDEVTRRFALGPWA